MIFLGFEEPSTGGLSVVIRRSIPVVCSAPTSWLLDLLVAPVRLLQATVGHFAHGPPLVLE